LEPGVIALKFLDEHGAAPFTGYRWPVGGWVDAGEIEPCRSGIHALRPRDLPYWLGAQLWEIELEGDVVEQERKLVARRGRLVRRRDEWNPDLLDAFVGNVLVRTRRAYGSVPIVSGYVADIERFRALGRTGLAAFAAARAAERHGGAAAYERERLIQAAWLAERLELGSI
jgi:hypothetical protein